jgi:hypothetical protein
MAIALRFLPDEDLQRFISRVAKDAVASGDLEGLVCTGLTASGIALIQTCKCLLALAMLSEHAADVDRTSDVQTAALLASYFLPPIKDKRIRRWVASYRSLLDQWMLYTARAKFDVARTAKARACIQMMKNAGKDTSVATAEISQSLGARLYIRCNCRSIAGQPLCSRTVDCNLTLTPNHSLMSRGKRKSKATSCRSSNDRSWTSSPALQVPSAANPFPAAAFAWALSQCPRPTATPTRSHGRSVASAGMAGTPTILRRGSSPTSIARSRAAVVHVRACEIFQG